MKGNDIMKSTYDDIINLNYSGIKNHKKMSIYNRAAQFAPFAALTGYERYINETARLTNEKVILSNQMIEKLNLKLSILKEYLTKTPTVKITHFVEDEKKSGGSYENTMGIVKKIEDYNHSIIMDDRARIYIKDIYEIESDIFKGMED